MQKLVTRTVLIILASTALADRAAVARAGNGNGHDDDDGDCARRPLVFDFEPGDYIAASLAPGAFPASFPPGVGQMSEPAIQHGLLLAGKLRDPGGAVVGFATEQADADFQALVSTGTWTLTVPGRGTLFLSQREDLTLLVQILGDMQAHGQLERTWSPPLEVVTTIGAGEIVGGTGDFEGAKGRFLERDFVESISLLTGSLRVTDRLELDARVPRRH
ncbi:MAG TPA: hypothetical protein VHE35_23050 [Kofleriaceae bacterium]|nr:hypothetical protein [Kofleriaceae bacterium]